MAEEKFKQTVNAALHDHVMLADAYCTDADKVDPGMSRDHVALSSALYAAARAHAAVADMLIRLVEVTEYTLEDPLPE